MKRALKFSLNLINLLYKPFFFPSNFKPNLALNKLRIYFVDLRDTKQCHSTIVLFVPGVHTIITKPSSVFCVLVVWQTIILCKRRWYARWYARFQRSYFIALSVHFCKIHKTVCYERKVLFLSCLCMLNLTYARKFVICACIHGIRVPIYNPRKKIHIYIV